MTRPNRGRFLDTDLLPKGFRVPCAGCGRKMHPSKLVPVAHGNPLPIDKRCESCAARLRDRGTP